MTGLSVLVADIDNVQLNFNPASLTALNIVLGVIMLGIALETKPADFRGVLKMPKAMAVGIAAQFLLLPAITFALSLALGVRGSIAMGMILVACCPPGTISNVLTHRSGGNVALSVSMTAVSNVLAIFLMPLNVAFWGGLHPKADDVLSSVDLSAWEMLRDVALIIGVPFVIGIFLAHKAPGFATKVQPWVRKFSLIALLVFIIAALAGNAANFIDHIAIVAIAVFIHDTLALLLGYGIGRSAGLASRDTRAITFETGVRNAGLGLGMVFSFFDGIGGMAMVAGWWGVWDIIAGLALASWWSSRDRSSAPAGTAA